MRATKECLHLNVCVALLLLLLLLSVSLTSCGALVALSPPSLTLSPFALLALLLATASMTASLARVCCAALTVSSSTAILLLLLVCLVFAVLVSCCLPLFGERCVFAFDSLFSQRALPASAARRQLHVDLTTAQHAVVELQGALGGESKTEQTETVAVVGGVQNVSECAVLCCVCVRLCPCLRRCQCGCGCECAGSALLAGCLSVCLTLMHVASSNSTNA